MKKITLICIAAIALASCRSNDQTTASADKTCEDKLVQDGKLFTSMYQQRAAEYRALCFQAYNIATFRLDQALQKKTAKPLAVVTDLDETAFDNSQYSVHQALQDKDYTLDSWQEWSAKGDADSLAGAVSFFNYAASKKVEIFYITNRYDKEREGTLKNLKKFGFPYADDKHLITRKDSSSKELRRQSVSATHDIVLLLGDNLADFSPLFDKKPEAERLQNVQNNAAAFGKKFIILPNANYGDWESSVYLYNNGLILKQKDSVVRGMLKGY
jgi:5'-nucleotidase (lipoprotein e(P4) family)